MPKVSVVVPCFNHAPYLVQRLGSILAQTYRDFEIVLLDDASTDGSLDVLRGYAQRSMVRELVVNECNSGSPFQQWSKGLAVCSSPYVWIAESDDFADATMLGKLVQMLDSSPRIGIAYSQSWAVDRTGGLLFSLSQWTDDLSIDHWRNDFVNSGKDECGRYVVRKCTIPNASAVLFKRAVYEQVGGVDVDFRLAGDWMLWAKMLLRCDVGFVSEKLNYFRCHTASARNHFMRTPIGLLESIRIVEYIVANVDVANEIRADAINRLIGRWLGALSEGQWGVSHNLAVFRALHRLDQSLFGRLAARTMSAVARRLRQAIAA